MWNKRGIGSEIDWILASGIFILSVVFIFILFRPGVSPVHNSQALLNILQDGFSNDTEWEIIKFPVFLAPANSTYATVGNTFKYVELTTKTLNSDETISLDGETRLAELLDGKNKYNIEIYYLKRDEDDNPNFGTLSADEDSTFSPGNSDSVPDTIGTEHAEDVQAAREQYPTNSNRYGSLVYNLTSDETLIMPAFLEDDNKTKYLVTVADKSINFELDNLTEDETLDGCSVVGGFDATDSFSDTVANSCPVLYDFGVTEKTSGIHLASFIGLNRTTGDDCVVGYDCVKDKWKFPQTKEFKINVTSIPVEGADGGPEINVGFPQKIVVPQNINVFVRRFNSFVLTDDGTRIPVVVEIKVW